MKVTLSEENGISVIGIEGSIDGKTAPVVRQEIAPALESAKKAILDLSKVESGFITANFAKQPNCLHV